MATNGDTSVEDTEMVDGEGDQIVTMMDVLKEQQDFEDDANAVLGASDEKECTYAQGYIKRQAIYACMTCCPESKDDTSKRAGFCLACSLACHENHELIELYTKRNFRCDCGNPKFKTSCQFTPIKLELNEENVYNQNFVGLYCSCNQPYEPDAVDDEMIQCIVCEDWWHASHLDAVVPANDQYSEMICKMCMSRNEFLHDYTDLAVNAESGDIDVVKINGTDEESSTLSCDKLDNGTVTYDETQTNGNTASDKLTNGSEKTEDDPENIDAMDTSTIESKNDVAYTEIDNEFNITNAKDSTEAEEHQSLTETEKYENPLVSEKGEKNIAPMDTNDAVAEAEGHNVAEPISTNSEDVTVPSEDSIANEDKTEDSIATEDKTENSNGPTVDQDVPSADKTDVEDCHIQKEIEDNDAVSVDKENVPEESSTENAEQTVDKDESQQPGMTQNDEGSQDNTDALKEDSIDAAGKSEEETSEENITEEQIKVEDINKLAEAESNGNDDTSQNVVSETAVKTPNSETTNTIKTEETSQDIQMDDTSKETDKEFENTVVSKEVENSPNKMGSNKEAKATEESDDTNSFKEVVPNLSCTENKRKLSTEDDIDLSVKKPKLDGECARPKGVQKVCKGATFWPSHFRQKLCTCSECIAMYKDLNVLFLTDKEDTVFAYETLGKERTAGKPNQYEKGMAALSSLGRIQQIDALTEYNKMRDKLLTFLQSFKDRKEIVTEQDIKTFFAGMKPQKRMDGVYFFG